MNWKKLSRGYNHRVLYSTLDMYHRGKANMLSLFFGHFYELQCVFSKKNCFWQATELTKEPKSITLTCWLFSWALVCIFYENCCWQAIELTKEPKSNDDMLDIFMSSSVYFLGKLLLTGDRANKKSQKVTTTCWTFSWALVCIF